MASILLKAWRNGVFGNEEFDPKDFVKGFKRPDLVGDLPISGVLLRICHIGSILKLQTSFGDFNAVMK
jgi:hypothetical protein